MFSTFIQVKQIYPARGYTNLIVAPASISSCRRVNVRVCPSVARLDRGFWWGGAIASILRLLSRRAAFHYAIPKWTLNPRESPTGGFPPHFLWVEHLHKIRHGSDQMIKNLSYYSPTERSSSTDKTHISLFRKPVRVRVLCQKRSEEESLRLSGSWVQGILRCTPNPHDLQNLS